VGAATLEELEEEGGDKLELVFPGGWEEVVEGGGVLVLLGRVLMLVGEVVGFSVVVVVGTAPLPKFQVPKMTP
jgi:hypothetical protein